MLNRGWTTVIAHRLGGPNGEFLGVMARRIDAASYEKFFASVVLGPGAAISMFHIDGTILARYPHVDKMIGKNFKSAPMLQGRSGKGRAANAPHREPGRSSGSSRRRGDAEPFPDRDHRHQHG